MGSIAECDRRESGNGERETMKKYFVALVFLALLPQACTKSDEAAPTRPAAPKFAVQVEEASVQDVVYKIESVGTLEAEEDVRIPARVDGAVSRVHFNEGDRVTPEKVLVEIDPARYGLEVDRARANLEKARAEVEDARQALEQRQSLREKNPGWVTQEELRKLQTAMDRAQAEVSGAEVELNLALKKQSDARVRSPFSGVINGKSVSTGEYVKAETVVATIARIENLKLRFHVPEVDAARIQQGQSVDFVVRAIPEKTFSGKIFFISTVADPETRMVEVKAHVANSDLQLRPGYFASVSLKTSVHRNAILVPEEAVIPTETGFVSYIVQDGVAMRRPIDIGQRTEGRVEILKGLKQGELVVIRGGHSLTDGMAVEMKF